MHQEEEVLYSRHPDPVENHLASIVAILSILTRMYHVIYNFNGPTEIRSLKSCASKGGGELLYCNGVFGQVVVEIDATDLC